MQIVSLNILMTNTRSGLTTQTTPMVAARRQKKNPQVTTTNPPFQYCYSPPPNMCTPSMKPASAKSQANHKWQGCLFP